MCKFIQKAIQEPIVAFMLGYLMGALAMWSAT